MENQTTALVVYDEAFAGSHSQYSQKVDVQRAEFFTHVMGDILHFDPPGSGFNKFKKIHENLLNKQPITVQATDGLPSNAMPVEVTRSYGFGNFNFGFPPDPNDKIFKNRTYEASGTSFHKHASNCSFAETLLSFLVPYADISGSMKR